MGYDPTFGASLFTYDNSTGSLVLESIIPVPGVAYPNPWSFSDIEVSGELIIASGKALANSVGTQGRAMIFRRVAGSWILEADLSPTSGVASTEFGTAATLDGDHAAVGASADGVNQTGLLYTYQRIAGNWVSTGTFAHAAAASGEGFGLSAEMQFPRMVVSAPGVSGAYHAEGRSYVFKWQSGGWVQEAVLQASAQAVNESLGFNLSLDGNRIALGSVVLTIPGRGKGASYAVFEESGGAWVETARLHLPGGHQGWLDAIDLRGDRLAIGRNFISSPSPYATGGVSLFECRGGAWVHSSDVKHIPDGTSSLTFGSTVELLDDQLLVGDSNHGMTFPGVGVYPLLYSFTLAPAFESYCTSKTNSLGCSPAIGGRGVARASAPSGFEVRCDQVLNQTVGILFYGTNGRASTPFQGGTLCVAPPFGRSPVVASGGTPGPTGDCTGFFAIDMNALGSGQLGVNPLPALRHPGTVVQCQWWGRDQGLPPPGNSQLSDGLEYLITNVQ